MLFDNFRANDKQNVMELLEIKDDDENSEVGKERKESVAIFNNQVWWLLLLIKLKHQKSVRLVKHVMVNATNQIVIYIIFNEQLMQL